MCRKNCDQQNLNTWSQNQLELQKWDLMNSRTSQVKLKNTYFSTLSESHGTQILFVLLSDVLAH